MASEAFTLAEQFFSGAHGGDRNVAKAVLHPEAVIEPAGGCPFSGTYVGPNAVLELGAKIDEGYTIVWSDEGLHDAGEFAVKRVTVTFTSKTNGRSATTRGMVIVWAKDGKIIRLDGFHKNSRLFDELVGDAP